ncbi:MAG TPA: hypothetical protein VMV09_07125 [Candidatus Saccharimonadales bacterium]|nr:hypothetical protein [Candidatus Saccharimonadales bacterium]
MGGHHPYSRIHPAWRVVLDLVSWLAPSPEGQLRNDPGPVMRGVDQGKTFTVTGNGIPIGAPVPLRWHRFVTAESVPAIFRGATSSDVAKLRAHSHRISSQNQGATCLSNSAICVGSWSDLPLTRLSGMHSDYPARPRAAAPP